MSTLLVGDATTTYPISGSTSAGDVEAFAYTADASGTVTELQLLLHPSTSSSCTSVVLGVYDDASGIPGTLLGAGTYSGAFTVGTWVSVTGLSIPVTAGHVYWLAMLPIGGTLRYKYAVSSGGTGDAYENVSTAFTSMPGTYPNSPPTDVYDDGPIGFQALGTVADPDPGPTAAPAGLVFHFTGIWKPGDTAVPYYGQVVNPLAGETVEQLDDSTTASVTITTSNPILKKLEALAQQPYAIYLKVYDCGVLAFWGAVKLRTVDTDAHTVKYDAVDPSLRLIKHMLRRGDLLLGGGQLAAANNDRGYLPISGAGLRLLRDAGDVDGTVLPTLGIIDGSDDYTADPNAFIGVQRGEQVWNDWLALCAALGPDFTLEPIDDTAQAYARLNVYEHLGEDRSATVQLHYQTGRRTLDGLSFTDGEDYINMVHVLDRDNKLRVTVTNATALGRTGPVIAWLNTDFAWNTASMTKTQAEDVLRAYGEAMIKAYSVPLIAVTLKLPVDSSSFYRYRRDFGMGDTVGVAGKDGLITLPEAPYRITKVTRALEDEDVRTTVEVIADRTTDDTIDGTDV